MRTWLSSFPRRCTRMSNRSARSPGSGLAADQLSWTCGRAAGVPNQGGSLKASAVGKNEKMELLYSYLSGPEFRRRVEAIAAAFSQMQKQLNDERRAMERIRSQREKQIIAVSTNISGMYGDLQGYAESALPDIPSLALQPGETTDPA